jgi:hypothetical protein
MNALRRALPTLTALSALLLPAAGRALHAQAPASDSASVVATMQRLFDGLAQRDTVLLRAVLLPGTRFVSLSADRPSSAPHTESDSAALRDIATTTERMLERMWHPVVQVQGRIATLRAPYDFHVDGRFSHCGIDTATLVRTDAGWRIAALVYTVQRTGCAPSPLGPPAQR